MNSKFFKSCHAFKGSILIPELTWIIVKTLSIYFEISLKFESSMRNEKENYGKETLLGTLDFSIPLPYIV